MKGLHARHSRRETKSLFRMDLRDREDRERRAFDEHLSQSPLSAESLVISDSDIDRYGHPFARNHYPIDLLFLTLGDVREKEILDLGCGDGLWSTLLALAGGRPIGIEISEKYAITASQRARANGVGDHVVTLQASAHDLPFPSSGFDIVFGNMILHHLDAERAAAEIHRVLRAGGRGVFLEPVAFSRTLRHIRKTWFFSRIVRNAGVSPDEEPLTRDDIARFSLPFSAVRIRETQMLSRVARLLGGGTPLRILNDLDNELFRTAPVLRRFARYAVIELVK